MKCVAFITPAVTVIAHSYPTIACHSPSARLPAMQNSPSPFCGAVAKSPPHIHSIAYRPPVVALSVQRQQQHELGADVTAMPELSSDQL